MISACPNTAASLSSYSNPNIRVIFSTAWRRKDQTQLLGSFYPYSGPDIGVIFAFLFLIFYPDANVTLAIGN